MASRFELDSNSDPGPNLPMVSPDSLPQGAPASRLMTDRSDPEDRSQAGNGEPDPLQPNLLASQEDASWRSEVADRVSRYRARRRPRAPHYPSLTLKFDSPEPKPGFDPVEAPTHQALAIDSASVVQEPPPPLETGKLLEFPRPLVVPPRPLDELAEPVLDRPRILDVPEVASPPPALGGILIEPVEAKVEEKRPGFEIPLQAARMSRRLAASAIDAIVVLAASALFGYVFFRVTKTIPPLQTVASAALILVATFWSAYQFLLLFYTGSTPGLRLAKLQLSRFDGDPVPRRLRGWRVLASLLSGVSLGLGYAWCFLDEDQLCWHDRITRTYIAPKGSIGVPPATTH